MSADGPRSRIVPAVHGRQGDASGPALRDSAFPTSLKATYGTGPLWSNCTHDSRLATAISTS